jgi:hypothetical protein
MIIVAAVLGALMVVFGGLLFVTNSNLSKAESKAEQLDGSLEKTTAELESGRSKLATTQKELEASKQEAADATATAQAVIDCATGLFGAWTDYFDGAYDAAGAKLDSTMPGCQEVLGEAAE